MSKKKKIDRVKPPIDIAKQVDRMIKSYDFTKQDVYAVDLFCGFGGVTFGLTNAKYKGKKIVKILACINHDIGAIKSHKLNHPGAIHLTEDIRAAKLQEIARLIAHIRKVNPNAKILLWASVECTNFSKAKGGMSRKADSRTLASALFRYVRELKPDMLWMENVEEFLDWGPLMEKVNKASKKMGPNCPIEYDKKQKTIVPIWVPIPEKKGIYYNRFVQLMQRAGNYNYEYKKINAADFGAHTSRKRLFIQFNAKDMDIVWPHNTHAKEPLKNGKIKPLKKWKAVKQVLQLEEHGESIFARDKPYCEKTHERIFWGLVKFVAGSKEDYAQYMVKWLGTSSTGHMKNCTQSLTNTAPTITTQNRYGMATVKFIDNYYGKGYASGLDIPAHTLRTHCSKSVVTAFIMNKQFNPYTHNHSVEIPAPVLLAHKDKQVVSVKRFIYRDFSNGGSHQSINSPAGSLPCIPKISLVTADPFIMDTQYSNIGQSINRPGPTLIASKREFYLINPQWGTHGNKSIKEPCFTLIARMDKAPPHLVSVEGGYMAIVVNESDDYWMRLIKEFCAAYGIADIKMRMLFIKEKLKIQGLPGEYKMVGSKTDQNKWIGNCVPPIVPLRMIEHHFEHHTYKIAKAA